MADDLPSYETMYGIYITDWNWTYGGGFFNGVHYTLTKEYLSEGCITEDYTQLDTGTNVIYFLYPHWIKKVYFVEGVVEGQFTVSCTDSNATLTSYKIRLMKIDNDGNTEEIGTTDTIVPSSRTFSWDATYDVGDEIVYPFYITVSPEVKVEDEERLYVELTIISVNDSLILYHSNDATWEDFKISIPFRGL